MKLRETARASGMTTPGTKAPSPLRSAGALHETLLGAERAEASELPEGWRIARLDEVVKSSRPSRGSEAATDSKIPFIPMALLPNDGLPTTRWEMRSAEEVRSGVPFAEGDVLLAKITPCLENGKLGVASAIPGGWGMTSTEVYPLRAECVTTEFLAYFLTLPYVRHGLASKMQGATGRQRLPKEALYACLISVPPLPEQRAIAGVLRTVQEAKEACERLLAATRQLKQSLLHHLFTCGPVPFPQADQVPLKETEMGVFPEHWRLTNLGTLSETLDGTIQTGPFGSQLHKAEYVDLGVPVVNPTHLLGNRINHAEVPCIAESKAADLARHRLRTGDILLARRGEIGRHGFVTDAENGWQCGTGCFLVRVNDPGIFNPFLPWYFARRQVVEWLEANAAGAIMPNLNNTTLARLPILFPPLSEQREIAQQLSAVDAKLAALESRRAALAALFTSLLHHLMTARLRLPEFVNAKAPRRQDTEETAA